MGVIEFSDLYAIEPLIRNADIINIIGTWLEIPLGRIIPKKF